MLTEYAWDAQAAKGIKDQELDRHFERNLNTYLNIVRPVWALLCKHHRPPSYLKYDDLYAPLVPIFERASILQDALGEKGLPQTGERGSTKWLCWFTHYVVEQCLIPIKSGQHSRPGQTRVAAKLRLKNQDKIKEDIRAS